MTFGSYGKSDIWERFHLPGVLIGVIVILLAVAYWATPQKEFSKEAIVEVFQQQSNAWSASIIRNEGRPTGALREAKYLHALTVIERSLSSSRVSSQELTP
jgi:hypothetical protein